MRLRYIQAFTLLALGLAVLPARAADNDADRTSKSQTPALHLSDDQRAKIRGVVSQRHSDVSFEQKKTKNAKDFTPSVGAKIPKGLAPQTLPPPLIYEMPALKRFTYLKFKDEILIVNPMTKKIVDMFPLS